REGAPRICRYWDYRFRERATPLAEEDAVADLDVADQLAVDCLAEEIIELGDCVFLCERSRALAKAIVPVAANARCTFPANSQDGRSGKQLDVGEDGPVRKKILEGKILDQSCLIDASSDCWLRQQRLDLGAERKHRP